MLVLYCSSACACTVTLNKYLLASQTNWLTGHTFLKRSGLVLINLLLAKNITLINITYNYKIMFQYNVAIIT